MNVDSAQLAGDGSWTRLAPADALPNDDDWITAVIDGRSVFVQRLGDQLRGFENICAHRFYPLRTESRGNGPIRCGFHHWRYDEHGSLRGAPQCVEHFGVKPGQLNAGLNPIELRSRDGHLFGRLAPAPRCDEPLRHAPMGDDWALPMSDPAAYAREQAVLKAGWNFLGCAGERPPRGDANLETTRCGDFVFGRPKGAGGPDLEAFLSLLFPILSVLSKTAGPRHRAVFRVAANWRLWVHITLDDYHLLAIHPKTLGANGFRLRETMGYHRADPHSAHFTRDEPGSLEEMAQQCRDGAWRSSRYRIFQVFPNLVVTHFHTSDEYWYVQVQHLVPLGPAKTRLDSWIYPVAVAPLGPRPRHDRWTSWWTRPWRSALVDHRVARIMREDSGACENLQRSVGQIGRPPFLAAVEERIAWFEEAYRAAMAPQP